MLFIGEPQKNSGFTDERRVAFVISLEKRQLTTRLSELLILAHGPNGENLEIVVVMNGAGLVKDTCDIFIWICAVGMLSTLQECNGAHYFRAF